MRLSGGDPRGQSGSCWESNEARIHGRWVDRNLTNGQRINGATEINLGVCSAEIGAGRGRRGVHYSIGTDHRSQGSESAVATEFDTVVLREIGRFQGRVYFYFDAQGWAAVRVTGPFEILQLYFALAAVCGSVRAGWLPSNCLALLSCSRLCSGVDCLFLQIF